MKSGPCPHCLPTIRQSHMLPHMDYYLDVVNRYVPWQFDAFLTWKQNRWVTSMLFRLLYQMGIVEFDPEPPVGRFLNRSLIFFHEAKRRELDVTAIKVFGTYVGDFRLMQNGKDYYYEGTPLHIWELPDMLDQKQEIKQILMNESIPVPEGRSFRNQEAAIQYGRTLGFPLVVKPVSGSLSYHSTYPVTDNAGLADAIRIAKVYQPRFMVERFIPGHLYRATVIGKQHVFICLKERANVIGDGISTIQELITIKNGDERRMESGRKDATLHHIPVDDDLGVTLLKQGLHIASIPDVGARITLHSKNILSMGCDIINCTNETHPENVDLMRRIATTLNADLVGIDFIADDITQSFRDQQCGVIETNSLPYIDMHAYPSHGSPERVAEIAWDHVLSKLV